MFTRNYKILFCFKKKVRNLLFVFKNGENTNHAECLQNAQTNGEFQIGGQIVDIFALKLLGLKY